MDSAGTLWRTIPGDAVSEMIFVPQSATTLPTASLVLPSKPVEANFFDLDEQ
jgi:hypothetical protein